MNTARVVPKKYSPNEQIVVGLIGLGGRCKDIVRNSKGIGDMKIVAVSDCFQPRIGAFINEMGKDQGWKGYPEFRTMIETENLDGVMVETTTHARAWVTCQAMAMGVDTYIEKPMCLTIAEGRDMVTCARKYKAVTQIGTQQRSMPLNNWASDLVKNGHIGKVNVVRAPNFMGPVKWEPQPAMDMPDGGSENWWDLWTNQAEMRPYHNKIQYSWANWWAYDGGGRSFGVTGWGTHSYDQIQRGLGTDETGPAEVTLLEPLRVRKNGKFEERTPAPTETGARYYGMANTMGPRAKVNMKFKNGTEIHFDLDGDWGPGLGCIFEGEKGTIEINRDMISASDPALISGADRPPALSVPETEPHIQNWIDCIKSRERCTADIEYGQRASSLCYLVNIVRDVGKVGETLHWDPKKERFTDCDEANTMLSRPRRKGYELPV